MAFYSFILRVVYINLLPMYKPKQTEKLLEIHVPLSALWEGSSAVLNSQN